MHPRRSRNTFGKGHSAHYFFRNGFLHLLSPWCVLNQVKSSQVNTLPKAKSKTRSKQNKDMHKCSRVYSERGVPLSILTSGGD
jgi:hypothetical protein